MPHALGHAGRARRIEPERRLLGMGRHGRKGIALPCQFVGELLVAERVAAGHHDMFEIRHAADDVFHDGIERFGDEQHARAAIRQHVGILIRGQQRIERHRHDAGADRAEEHAWKIHRVEHDHRHALFAADAEPAQHVGDAAALPLQLAIGEFGDGIGEGELGAAALVDIAVEQPGHCIVGTGRAAHDAFSQVLRIIIHRKTRPRLLSILIGIMFPKSVHHQSQSRTRAMTEASDPETGFLEQLGQRVRTMRAPARDVAKSARQGFGYFRALYRAARKRQGQRLDRAAAPGIERDGRASRRSHSRQRACAGLGRDPRSPAQGDAGADRAGQGHARRQRPFGAAAESRSPASR